MLIRSYLTYCSAALLQWTVKSQTVKTASDQNVDVEIISTS